VGLRIRVVGNPLFMETFRRPGADPVNMNWAPTQVQAFVKATAPVLEKGPRKSALTSSTKRAPTWPSRTCPAGWAPCWCTCWWWPSSRCAGGPQPTLAASLSTKRINTSPASTLCPGATRISATTASEGEATPLSIFIDSRVTRSWPR